MWVQIAGSGKKMPVDEDPIKVVVDSVLGWQVRNGFTSHFATCPDADAHRKDKK